MKTLLAILFFSLVFYYLGKKEGAEEEKARLFSWIATMAFGNRKIILSESEAGNGK